MKHDIDIVKIILREFNASGEREDDIFDYYKTVPVQMAENKLVQNLDSQTKKLFDEYKSESLKRQINIDEKLVAYVLKFLKACKQGPFNTTVEKKSTFIRFD